MTADDMKEFTHDLINKLVSAQGYMKVLSRTDLKEDQTEYLISGQNSLLEAIDIFKDFRKNLE